MRLFLLAIATTIAASNPCLEACPQDADRRAQVEAPDGMRRLRHERGGAYFVDRKLLDQYDALKYRLESMQSDLQQGNTSSAEVLELLPALQLQIKAFKDKIEEEKVLVRAYGVYTQRKEEVFAIGGERLVVITSDHLRVRGWDGPGIKVVVDKTLISDEMPDAEDFDSITIEHSLAVSPNLVGLTQAQRELEEQEFLDSAEGRRLTPTQREQRGLLIDSIIQSFAAYRDFQGKEVNSIRMRGLTFEEGNRSLPFEIVSPNGEGFHSSQWQREAQLTVYLPACRSIAVRGCMSGFDIENISADLVLTDHDSRDRDYEGTFAIRHVKGSVSVHSVPFQQLEHVSGDVMISATADLANSGTSHFGGRRTFSPYAARESKINDVEGSVEGTFVRTNVELARVSGVINVTNDFGSTKLEINEPLSPGAHRVISQSGSIELTGTREILAAIPIHAYTECGQLKTNASRELIEEASFLTGSPKRNWHGFVSPNGERFSFSRFQRPSDAIEGKDRADGLDLISRAGTITITVEDE